MLHWLCGAGGSFHLNSSQNVLILPLIPMWFWGVSNKYIHCGVSVQLGEIHVHSTVGMESVKPLSDVSVGFLDLS